jgi:IS30 family transposase
MLSPLTQTISIDERSSIVDSRERFGDREIDTVLGKHGSGVIVTILERVGFIWLRK